ncbi:hypothetical protein CDIK_4469, partial [Cucumispora dikerogammari]
MQKSLDFEKKTIDRRSFNMWLLEAFASANIPIEKHNNVKLINFIEDFTNERVYSSSWYRQEIIPNLYDREYKLLIEQFKNNNIYFVFDETTDIIGRQILNLLIGLCDETERKTAKLVKTIFLEKTNSLNMNIEILKLLDELFTTKDQYNNVRLI